MHCGVETGVAVLASKKKRWLQWKIITKFIQKIIKIYTKNYYKIYTKNYYKIYTKNYYKIFVRQQKEAMAAMERLTKLLTSTPIQLSNKSMYFMCNISFMFEKI